MLGVQSLLWGIGRNALRHNDLGLPSIVRMESALSRRLWSFYSFWGFVGDQHA